MNSFNRTQRLLKKNEFDLVFSQSKKIVTPCFIFFYRHNTLTTARLGMALSKKNIPKAHDRNRLKRLLRETFRTTILSPIDIVVIARAGITQLAYQTVLATVRHTWTILATK